MPIIGKIINIHNLNSRISNTKVPKYNGGLIRRGIDGEGFMPRITGRQVVVQFNNYFKNVSIGSPQAKR